MPLSSSRRKVAKESRHRPCRAPSPTLPPRISTTRQPSSRPLPPSTKSSNEAVKTTMPCPALPSAHLALIAAPSSRGGCHCKCPRCHLLRTFPSNLAARNRPRRNSTSTRSTCMLPPSKPRLPLLCRDIVGAWIGAGRARTCITAPSRRKSKGVRMRVPSSRRRA